MNLWYPNILINNINLDKRIIVYGNRIRETNNLNPVVSSTNECGRIDASPMSICQKIMEKIIYNRLFSFLEKFNILCKYQFRFIPNKNTTHAISKLVDYVINSLENNEIPCSIFLDTSKAFDTIDHKIQLSNLYKYGIRGKAQNWFKDYLSERDQYGSINYRSSSLQKIKCGVPHGSILGPILFLLYINDLPNESNIQRSLLYSDDTNILYKNLDPKSITDDMNKEIP